MNEKENYLLRAYSQNHFDNGKEMLSYLESEFGKGLILDLHRKLIDKYGMPKLGTGRATYISKFCVFKLPVTLCGFRLNDWEGSVSSIGKKGTPYYIPIARSKLIFIDDIPIVVMEKVQESSLSEIKSKLGLIPDFVSSVDMGQVGFNHKGQLVAYDYADL